MPDADTHSTGLSQLPAFLEALEQSGMSMDIEHYPRIHAILERAESTARLKTLLCPIVATDSEGQALFYDLFDRFFGAEEEPAFVPLDVPGMEKTGPGEAALLKPEKGRGPEKEKKEEWADGGLITRLAVLVFLLALVAFFLFNQGLFTEMEYAGILLAILDGTVLAYFLVQKFKGRLVARSIQPKEPPWFWSIELPLKERVDFGGELPLLARQLRRRLPGANPHLNIRQTLKETIQNGGALSLRYDFRSRPAEYLFLIDNTAFADHQHHLFEMLHRELLKNAVYVERFYYNDDMRVCWNEKYPQGIALEKLAARYADYRLLIFGDGKKMIHPASGALLDWVQVFTQWNDKAVLTPRPTSAWSYDELRLSELFVLLPSNMDGLLQAVEHFERLKSSNLKAWRYEYNQPEVRPEARFIREHFPPPLRDWIAACAIYPELNWELTLYLGEALSQHFGEPLLAFENIARIAQLSWFRNGRIPDDQRAALLGLLDEGLRLHAHQKIVDAMEEQHRRSPLPALSQAYSEFRLQLAVHKLQSGNYPEERKALKQTIRDLIAEGVRHDFIAIQSVRSPGPLAVEVPATLRNLVYATGEPAFWERRRQSRRKLFGALRLPSLRPGEKEKMEEARETATLPEKDIDDVAGGSGEAADETSALPPRPRAGLPPPDMVRVEGGAFQMGSDENDREKPIHEVRLDSFEIGRYPLTLQEYDAFCEASGREKPDDRGWGRENRPAIYVDWYDAIEYCNWLSGVWGLEPVYKIEKGKKESSSDKKEWLVTPNRAANGYRLPTEAEWEYAARGGRQSKGYRYAGSDNIEEVAWYDKNSYDKGSGHPDYGTHPVGLKKPNELGLYDMSGNVWEWCEDVWHENYKGAPADGSAWLSGGDSGRRVLRGGSWGNYAGVTRLSDRYRLAVENRIDYFGFRLARD